MRNIVLILFSLTISPMIASQSLVFDFEMTFPDSVLLYDNDSVQVKDIDHDSNCEIVIKSNYVRAAYSLSSGSYIYYLNKTNGVSSVLADGDVDNDNIYDLIWNMIYDILSF